MIELKHLTTEQRNEKTLDLDSMPLDEALRVMNAEDAKVAPAVGEQLPAIAKAVEAVVRSFESGGRLIYLGAGTSGRLGILDATECVPTFGTPPEMVAGRIAGGMGALVRSVEGAEDSATMGVDDLKELGVDSRDTVVGIAASGRTPYVIAALEYAKSFGCTTVGVTCNRNSAVGAAADIPVEIDVGPEVLTGSTRLKAGTAQKLALNMISTMAMVGIGKVYKNLMVDVQRTNEKLRTRAVNIVADAAEVDKETAREFLDKAEGSVKHAIVMLLLDCPLEEARAKLEAAKGRVRLALQ